jgi:hypothetical protein
MKIENGQTPAFVRALTLLAQEPAGRANHSGERKYAIPAHEDPEWLVEHEIDLELENRFEQPGFQAD